MSKAFRHPLVAGKIVKGLLHGGDYNPEQWLSYRDADGNNRIWKEDMRLARLAHINTFSVGIFSWAALEPAEGEFHFEWLDEILDSMAENKMAAVLATPSGARPAWLSAKYPEVLRVNASRQRALHGERHNHCLSSPVYREKVAKINTLLAERYKNHPALALWHVSNEYGGECHCPLCQAKFREWLKNRYKTLDALNAAWWTSFWSHTYTDWEQIESPSPIGESNLHGLNLAWRRFTSGQFVDFFKNEIVPLKKITPDIPCTTNLMATYPGINYFDLAQALDVVSWDNYPRWRGTDEDAEWTGPETAFNHDLNRSLKDKPFLMMESSPSATNWQPVCKVRRPGVHTLQSLQAVAHGSDSVQYFQFRKGRGGPEKFHGAVVGHDGTENTRIFREVAETGARLESLAEVAGCSNPAKAALVFDWENAWILSEVKGFLQKNTAYERTVRQHYASLWKLGVTVDIIDSTRPLEGYSLVAAPMLYMLRPGMAERITEFVRAGGVFVTTYITGYADQDDLCFPGGAPGPLSEVLGLSSEEVDSLYPEDSNFFTWEGQKYEIRDFCDLVNLKTAKPLAEYGQDFYAGKPVLTVNSFGKGKAYYMAARAEQDFQDAFYAKIAAQAALPRPVKPLPKGVTAQLRSDGKTDFVFLLNFTPRARTVHTDFAGSKDLKPWGVEVLKRPAAPQLTLS